jgi:DNA-binding XRE family transcriptional regulator
MPAVAKKKHAPDTDEPHFDLSKMKRGPSRHANRRLELPLAELRTSAGKTQIDAAKASGLDQSAISRLERRETLDDLEVGTLRRYVEGVGMKLELVAVAVNGARIVVTGAK